MKDMVLINLALTWLMITLIFKNKAQRLAHHIVTGLMFLVLFPRDLFLGLYFLKFLSMISSYLFENVMYTSLLRITHCSLVEIISGNGMI